MITRHNSCSFTISFHKREGEKGERKGERERKRRERRKRKKKEKRVFSFWVPEDSAREKGEFSKLSAILKKKVNKASCPGTSQLAHQR